MLINHYSLEPSQVGIFFLPPLLGDISALLLTGTRKNMFRVMRITFYAAIGCFFFLLFLPFWQGVWIFTFYGTLFGFVNCMVIQAVDTISLRFAPPKQEGAVFGIYKFFTSLGAVIGPSLLLFTVEYIWPLFGVMLFPIILTLSGLIFLKFINPMEKTISKAKN